MTTGLVDELPDVPGLRERWGRDVLHCPYCHGWEVRDQAIGVLASGPMSVHQALLFRQLSRGRRLLPARAPTLDRRSRPSSSPRAASRSSTARWPRLEVVDDRLTGVRLRRRHGGRAATRVVVAPRMVARAGFLAGLGLRGGRAPERRRRAHPGRPDRAGPTCPGVWVAGNVTDLTAQVGAAAAAGAMAGAQINADLVTEETAGGGRRVPRRRSRRRPRRRLCEQVAGDRRHGL